MTSTSRPPTLRPRWSSASSTESFMCLPMTPAGPESEVMNPILTVSAAAGETATTAARSPTRTARVIARTGSLLLVRLAAVPREHGPGTSGAILADAPGESPGAPALGGDPSHLELLPANGVVGGKLGR